MKKKYVVLGSIFIMFLIILWVTLPWLGMKGKYIALNSVVDAAANPEGGYWIVDQGGSRIVGIDADLRVHKLIQPKEEVKQIVVSPGGEIFLRTVNVGSQNNSIDREAVYRLEEKSGKQEVVYEIDHETSVLRSEIFQLSGLGDRLRIGLRTKDGFSLSEVDESGEPKQLLYLTMQDADVWVCDAVLNAEGTTAYYCLQDGSIFRYDTQKERTEKIYDGALLEGREGIPRGLSLNPSGELYFTDIGLRDIGLIKEDGVSYLVGNYALEKEEFLLQEAFLRVNVESSFVACSAYAVYLNEQGEMLPLYELELRGSALAGVVLSKIALLVVIIVVLVIAGLCLKSFLKKSNMIAKLMMAMCIVIVTLTAMFLAMVIPDYKEQMEAELKERTKNVSYLVSLNLPAEALYALDSVADFRGQNYMTVKNAIDAVFLKEEGIKDFYCTIYTIREDVITINYSSEESTGAVYPYDWTYEGSDEEKILNTGVGKVYSGLSNSDGNYTFALYPIMQGAKALGLVEVGVNTDPFNAHLNKLILDLLITVVVIAVVIIFVILEILVYLQGKKKMREEKRVFLPNQILRFLVFLIFFVTNMATSFLPVYALWLAGNTAGRIPAEIWASIVVSAEVFAGAVFSIKGSCVIDRLGERKAAVLSAILMSSGLFLRILPHLGFLILGQLIIGMGWGIILLIVNTRISLNSAEKDEGFAGYSAAAFNGINSGVVIGGFAMNFMSNQMVMALAAVFSLAVVLHVYQNIKVSESESESREEEAGEWSTLTFLTKKRVWSFLLLLVFPIIACGYYLNYMYPILASKLGLEEVYVGYSYLINGFAVLAFGNLLTSKIVKWVGRKGGLVLSVVLYGVVFLLISVNTSMPALFAGLALLGLADGFGLPLQSSYFMELEETKRYGYDRAAGIYSLVENLGQSLGPVIFGYILIFGTSKGLRILCVLISIMALLFLLLSGIGNWWKFKLRELEKREDEKQFVNRRYHK